MGSPAWRTDPGTLPDNVRWNQGRSRLVPMEQRRTSSAPSSNEAPHLRLSGPSSACPPDKAFKLRQSGAALSAVIHEHTARSARAPGERARPDETNPNPGGSGSGWGAGAATRGSPERPTEQRAAHGRNRSSPTRCVRIQLNAEALRRSLEVAFVGATRLGISYREVRLVPIVHFDFVKMSRVESNRKWKRRKYENIKGARTGNTE